MKAMERYWALDVKECGPIADGFSIEQIRRKLVTDRVGCQMYLFGEVGSTNEVLRHVAGNGAADGTVVLADAQTMGRGRLGKPWFSPAGVNLYVSVLCRPTISPRAVPVFGFVASLATADAVRAEGIAVAIKWPNDVLVGGRKIAGTLATYATTGNLVDSVILGVGVNVNVGRATLNTGLGPAAPGATSLAEVTGRPIDRSRFTATFLNALGAWDDEYRTHGPDGVLAAWRERDAMAGRTVEVREAGRAYRGRACGVNDAGRMVVEDAGGERHEVVAGEVVIVD
jgi:BirA family biotin operon repressor/biotin-[acetyl-CoA-carboxylase] ligase